MALEHASQEFFDTDRHTLIAQGALASAVDDVRAMSNFSSSGQGFELTVEQRRGWQARKGAMSLFAGLLSGPPRFSASRR